jgi:hypothetical protein
LIYLDTIEQEEFIYKIVIPQKRSSETFLSYRIYAFNQTFDLSLSKDETFLSPSFIVQYFNDNQTWINRDIEHCFYKGYVNGNHLSMVAISLCNGLVGNSKEILILKTIIGLDSRIARHFLTTLLGPNSTESLFALIELILFSSEHLFMIMLNTLSNQNTMKMALHGILNIYFIHIKISYYQKNSSFVVLLRVNQHLFFMN